MRIAHKAAAAAMLCLGLSAATMPASAGQWYFYVKNGTDTKLTRLEASENGKKWGYFNIGSGIAAGKTIKLNWDSSTDDQSCDQYLRATFSDGSEIKSKKIDFCSDLDDPIVFHD